MSWANLRCLLVERDKEPFGPQVPGAEVVSFGADAVYQALLRRAAK